MLLVAAFLDGTASEEIGTFQDIVHPFEPSSLPTCKIEQLLTLLGNRSISQLQRQNVLELRDARIGFD